MSQSATTQRDNDLDRSARTTAKERAIFLCALGGVVITGLSVRLIAIGRADFPINDGGMFYQAITQIQAAHFRLPADLHYNGLSIPFAYSPLGFYVAGLISSTTGASIVQLLRLLPFIFSLATMVAFMAFANEYLRDRSAVVVASLAFVLVPRSQNWEIMGGGLTRGLAYFFAILTLWQLHRLYTNHQRSSLILSSVFGALTCLSHIEVAWFVAFSAILFLVVLGRTKTGLRDSLLVGAGVLLLTSPWWGTVVARDGLAPFLNAAQSGAGAFSNVLTLLFVFNWGDEPRFPLFGALAALGIIVSLRRGKTFLPLWVLVALVLDTRKFQTDAMVPLSLMVGVVVARFLIPMMTDAGAKWFADDDHPELAGPRSTMIGRWLSPVVVAMMLGYGWMSSVAATAGSYTPLSRHEREAMSWVRASTPVTARFAVITGDSWAFDRSSEWFPALTDRNSIATVQGYEWTPNHGFAKQEAVYKELQSCSTETPACIAAWGQANGLAYDYVYIARREAQRTVVDYHAPCCTGLVELLKHETAYSLVYQNADATIFRHLAPQAVIDRPIATTPNLRTQKRP